MRENQSKRQTTDAEEEEMEAEQTESQDVFELLKSDHRRVEELFSRFEEADKRTKAAIAEETLMQLEIHTALEEALVYPAIRDAIDKPDMVDEAKEEHHIAKLLIKELHKMNAGDEEFAPKFKVLGEIIQHHVEEEENEMFPQAEEAGIDADELGLEVAKRKAKLMQKNERGGKKSSTRRKAA